MADTLIDYESKAVELTWIDAREYTVLPASSYLSVSPTGGRATRISWDNLPYADDATFYLQKSTSPTSGWATIAVLTMLDASYLDVYANNTMNRHELEYYRLVNVVEESVIGLARAEGYIDAYGAEMARRHRIQLINGRAGNRCFTFIKMRNAVRCPDCWDEMLQKRSKTNCATCKSTGFIQGYYNPIETYISFSAENVAINQAIDGPGSVNNAVQCWTSNYPMLNVGDVILEPGSNRFWSVQSLVLTMFKRVVTKQEVILQREDGDDPLLSLIDRVPAMVEGGTSYGKSIFQDDAQNSAGVLYGSTSELLY